MDVNASKSRFKKPKLLKGQHVDEGYDLISRLPDCILDVILSSLPTKNVVSTSVLSKRWKDLWKSACYLNFSDTEGKGDGLSKVNFMNFVDRVLKNHYSTTIKKFCLSCSDCDADRVVGCVDNALRREIRKFKLELFSENTLALPTSLFHCQFLTKLTLKSNHNVTVPNSICLPMVKSLRLYGVVFYGYDSTQTLFANCPSLVVLKLHDCEWMDFTTINIFAPNLEILKYYDRFRGSEMNVYAEKLRVFSYRGELSKDLSLYINPNLIEDAYVNVCNEYELGMLVAGRSIKLLRQLYNVRNLTLSWDIIDVFDDFGVFHNNFPYFPKLINFKLED